MMIRNNNKETKEIKDTKEYIVVKANVTYAKFEDYSIIYSYEEIE